MYVLCNDIDFGVTIDLVSTKKEYKGVAYPMRFQPYLYNTLPHGLKIDYLGSAFDREVYQPESSKKEKRRILITQNNVLYVYIIVRDRIRTTSESTRTVNIYGVSQSDTSIR